MLPTFTRLFPAFLIATLLITQTHTADIQDDASTPPPLIKRTSVLDANQTNTLHRAELGDTESELSMGKFYYNNKYRSKTCTQEEAEGNKIEAVKWLTLAAKKNHPEAQYLLGKCHHHALGVTRNTLVANMWYSRSAEQNYPKALYEMGKYCFYHTKEEKSSEKTAQNQTYAIGLLRRAADFNVANAEFFLGQCFFTGQGVAPDHNEAAKWCQRVAMKDHEIGIIAKCYIKKNALKIH